ncbi:FxDxF family PEP-CTERM protein [Sphingobium sp. SYK-6]|uniref:FxDxF family PEP-CTERM protein n=1 Tax=Sphingobium sp. (strain NBRC 103272 / SYK-6) TaxID=627192 RepID=UPI0002E27858|nr:FxDxF family PEP-CTERM protein [Sphingobium sp. SYK-6]
MKKVVFAAAAAMAALGLAPAANAAVVDPIDLSGGKVTDAFTGEVAGAGDFVDTFDFFLDTPSALTSSSITSILTTLKGAGDIDFTKVSFNGTILFDIYNNQFGGVDLATVAGVWLGAGAHTLVVEGTAFGAASYGGNINVSPVPEPATWAMMVAGIAAVGMTMRRRARNVRVAFS